MITISPDQALARWDTLPSKLKEALYSDVHSDFLWRTCEAEHVPKEKIYRVAAIAGYVLLGFIHAGDFAQELKDALGLDIQIATSIANAVNERVFKPLLADLEKIYEPPSAFAPVMISKTEPLKPVTEIKPPLLPAAKTAEPFAPSPSMPPVINRAEKPPAPLTPSISPVPPGKPAVPSPGTPPPMILHEEPVSAPLKKEFRLEMPQPKLSEIKLKTEATKPAVLEFGPSTSNRQQVTSNKEQVRVVHYTESKTPFGAAQDKPSGAAPSFAKATEGKPGREIKEITAIESSKPSLGGSDILKQLAAIRPATPQANKPLETAQDKLPTSEVKTPSSLPPVPKPLTSPTIPKPPAAPAIRGLDEHKTLSPIISEIKPPILPKPPLPPKPPTPPVQP
ncbi:MAG: hypothetical protein HY434_02360 [Candidatus Liptonbacteria bacterium]|nr:hypothetical protein [Candidatus Liptonbacteria bacterium]